MVAKLVTTRYVAPGVIIGELIRPKVTLSGDFRLCSYIGKGSRLASGKNLAIRRSFVYEESLVFPSTAPFESPLSFAADGVRNAPSRIFD